MGQKVNNRRLVLVLRIRAIPRYMPSIRSELWQVASLMRSK